jgi:hypothetical protein
MIADDGTVHGTPALIDPQTDNPSLGIGEAAGAPTVAAIGNAVAHALGTRIRDLPMARHRIMLANVLWWMSVSGNTYACAYNHRTGEVEIRDRNIRGRALHSFTNLTAVVDVERIFSRL